VTPVARRGKVEQRQPVQYVFAIERAEQGACRAERVGLHDQRMRIPESLSRDGEPL
jgi:hypothetical protein